jgi:hypothetical protein
MPNKILRLLHQFPFPALAQFHFSVMSSNSSEWLEAEIHPHEEEGPIEPLLHDRSPLPSNNRWVRRHGRSHSRNGPYRAIAPLNASQCSKTENMAREEQQRGRILKPIQRLTTHIATIYTPEASGYLPLRLAKQEPKNQRNAVQSGPLF